jgi:hypothetical protein
MDVPSGLGLPSETGGTAGSAFVIAVPASCAGQLGADVLLFEKLRAQKNV